MYDRDEFDEILNGESTYNEIAKGLAIDNRAQFIGWTDEYGTHFDILFTLMPGGSGNYQGGVRRSDLFVSIMRRGAFGFEFNGLKKHGSYIGEKLNVKGEPTCEKLSDLINAVMGKIADIWRTA